MTKNIHIYPTRFHNESRISKETKTLADSGIASEIIIVGYGDSVSRQYEKIDKVRKIWRVPLHSFSFFGARFRRLFRYLEWVIKIILHFRKKPIELINCHSIYDLLIGVILKKITGAILIYDTHELETERNGLKGIIKKAAKLIEKKSINHIDHLFTISLSIANWYQKQYDFNNVTMIYNAPVIDNYDRIQKNDLLRNHLSIPQESLLFLYQGALIKGRSIHLLLSVFSEFNNFRHIVFMGYGHLKDIIIQYQNRFANIHFMEAVPLKRILEYTSSADVGLSIIENICLSYYYCLPNKVMEYIVSGLPFIVSNFPDMGTIIDQYDCGWKTEVNKECIKKVILSLTPEAVNIKREKVLAIRKKFGWYYEEKKIIPIYKSLLAKNQ